MQTLTTGLGTSAKRCTALAIGTAAMLLGCGTSNSSATSSAIGGALATGGTRALGGASAAGTGGTQVSTAAGGASGGSSIPISDTGGITSVLSARTGGSSSSGGATATDQTSSTLVIATGGKLTTGGAPAQGGKQGAGGSATGGTSAGKTTGGDSITGGMKSTGGAASGGRATDSGSVATMGGTATSGGVSSNGTTPITIWMAGDSTMMNCTNSVCPCGWGSQLSSYFNGKVTVTNRAVGGRSVQTWLYESGVTDAIGSNGECTLNSNTYDSRWSSMLSSMKAGDYVMIAFGINDGDTTCPRHVGTTLFKSLLDMMVKSIVNKGGLPILLTPTDAIVCSGGTVTENRGFLTETKAIADADNVPLIDLNQLSMTLYGSLGFCPNGGDYTSTTSDLGKFFCDDHTHFEAPGAKAIAGLVVNAIRAQGIALAPYLI